MALTVYDFTDWEYLDAARYGKDCTTRFTSRQFQRSFPNLGSPAVYVVDSCDFRTDYTDVLTAVQLGLPTKILTELYSHIRQHGLKYGPGNDALYVIDTALKTLVAKSIYKLEVTNIKAPIVYGATCAKCGQHNEYALPDQIPWTCTSCKLTAQMY